MPEFCCECNNILIDPSEGPYCSGCQSRLGKPSRYDIRRRMEEDDRKFKIQKEERRKAEAARYFIEVLNKQLKGKRTDITSYVRCSSIGLAFILDQLFLDQEIIEIRLIRKKEWIDDEQLLKISRPDIESFKPQA